jgi:hypothetical protein
MKLPAEIFLLLLLLTCNLLTRDIVVSNNSVYHYSRWDFYCYGQLSLPSYR